MDRMLLGGESFWEVAYEPFMSRDLTRIDLGSSSGSGLEETRGNCKAQVQLGNMPQTTPSKRFSELPAQVHEADTYPGSALPDALISGGRGHGRRHGLTRSASSRCWNASRV